MIDPLSAAAWGSRTATSRLSFYIGRELTSALAPGMVVAAELFLLVACASTGRDADGLRSLVDDLSAMRGAALVLAGVLGLSAGYVVGWVSRELGFWLVGGLEWFRSRTYAREPDEEAPIVQRLRSIVGPDALADCVAHHPVLGALDAGRARPAGARRTWESLAPRPEEEAFAYGKLWLRRFAPDMSVDGIEADINILTAAVVPLALFAANVVAWSGEPLGVAALALPLLVAAIALLVRTVACKREDERWEAIRNLVEDHVMRMALARYPVTVAPATNGAGPEEGPG